MAEFGTRTYWDDVGAALLIAGVLLPPLAWFVDLQVSYALVKWACANDRREIILAVPLASLSLIAWSGAMSWSCWRQVRNGGNEHGGQVEDRSYMLALAGLGLSALFALLVLTSMATRSISPCE